VVSALYLATAIGQPVVGRLVDLFGPRPLYLAGTGLVGAAGLLGALLAFLMDPRPETWYFLALAGLAAAAFIARELKQSAPFLDVRVLKGNGPMLATYARQLLNFSAAYSFFYGYTGSVASRTSGRTRSSSAVSSSPLISSAPKTAVFPSRWISSVG
jgi:MFS family permease